MIEISRHDGAILPEMNTLQFGSDMKLGQLMLAKHMVCKYRDVLAIDPCEVGCVHARLEAQD